jgi:ATP adenylyltransferase
MKADSTCPFCQLPSARVELQNDLALAFEDGYPVLPGHRLVVPRRHVEDYWGLTPAERSQCHELLVALRDRIVTVDSSVAGFNIGLNAGACAGQTVFHCHFHLIPRRAGDVPDPRGGVRHLIPGKGFYQANEGVS